MSTNDVSPETLERWLADGDVRLIDVREADEFARTRIAGATSRPLSRFDPGAVAAEADGRTVLYCRSGRRSASASAALGAAGAAHVFNLAGGLVAWERAGLPVVRDRSAPISIMRQVQIAAGSLMLVGTLLGAFVSPWFLLLSGFVGAGLVFAGVTDTCAMAALLGKMPWNRAPAGCAAQPGRAESV